MFKREKVLETPDLFDFPFKPYTIQHEFMHNLYKVIENQRIGIFESPTGTGKSLSLTCGALKWLFDNEQIIKDELTDTMKFLSLKISEVDKISGNDDDWITKQFETIKEKEKLFELKKISEKINEHDRKMNDLKERKIKEKLKKWKQKITKKNAEENEILLPEREVDEDDFLIENDEDNDDDDAADDNNESSDQEMESNRTQIFYCSRTHSQLSQVVNEIKNTHYANRVRVVSLASRQNYCINDSVKRLNSNALINERCIEMQKCKSSARTTDQDDGKTVKKSKIQNTKCPFYAQHSIDSLRESSFTDIMDIEEICNAAKDEKACPYYSTRLAARDAHIVLLPYQMLLHEKTRRQTGLNINNAVIIIDEAHNLLDTIANIYSAAITLEQLQRAHQQLLSYKKKYFLRFSAKNLLKINQLIFVTGQIVKILTANDRNGKSSRMIRTDQLMMEGEFYNLKLNEILEFCETTRLAQKVHGFAQKFNDVDIVVVPPSATDRKSYLQLLAEKSAKKQQEAKTSKKKIIVTDNGSLSKCEAIVDQSNRLQSSAIRPLLGFLECLMENADDGRILINYSDGLKSKTFIKYLLLNPGAHFEEILMKCRSLIIAGGTMQPTAEFTSQLLGRHVNRIEEHFFGHVVQSDAVLPMAVSKGPTGRQFSFTYANRTNKDMVCSQKFFLFKSR